MSSAAEARIQQLTQPMLRKRLFVVLSQATARPEAITACLPEHLLYMIGLERQGVLFASGPLTAPGAAPQGDGLTILRVDSADEARAIAERDPFFANGLRTFEVREWTVMEGSVGLKVNFSDRSVEIT